MTQLFRFFLIAGLIALMPLSLIANTDNTSTNSVITTEQLGKMPLAFTENVGQWDETVKFRANAGGATMWFAPDGAYYQFTRSVSKDEAQAGPIDPIHLMEDRMDQEPEESETMMIKASFVNANPNPVMSGFEMMEYKCNYFIGNDPNEWHTDVPNYQAVLYEQVYDGIDLKYYGNGQQMEYDFIVEPGADFSQILIKYEGAESVSVNSNGELVVETKWGEVIEQKPIIYQIENDERIAVVGEYSVKGTSTFGFELENYNPALPLVIDPVLLYSTYLGGSSSESAIGIAVDISGSAYVTGYTESTNYPIIDPYQTNQSDIDVFVTKLSSSGNSLIYSTYLGGSGGDVGWSIAVDGSGSAYVTGYTESTNYPTLNSYQTTFKGNSDVFVTKLSSSGNSIDYSTYLGGSSSESARGIAVDISGSAYVTGSTASTDFPTLNPYQTYLAGYDVFVTKLSSSGNSLIYSTYLGGSGVEGGYGIAVDGSGAAYVTGRTSSTDFPTNNPYQANNRGYVDAFVTKLSSSGSSLIYSTYLGGVVSDYGRSIAVDGSGSAYVTGYTLSANFPTLDPYQTADGNIFDSSDVFVTKLTSSGGSLVYSTFLGGSGGDVGWSIAVDGSGAAYVTGRTSSTDFPTLNPYQTDQGGYDVFVTKLSSSGNSLIYSTYQGGDGYDRGYSIAVDISGSAYVTGYTLSADFLTHNPFQETNGGSGDVFVVKIISEYGYTNPGEGVVVPITDSITITFESVAEAGETVLSIDSVGTGTSPDGYKIVPSSPPVYYNITTNAVIQGDITVCFNYDPSIVHGPEHKLSMFHWSEELNHWEDITTMVDTANNIICGVSTSLSPFVLAEPPCCGFWTVGATGNTNCDGSGLRDLADITRLIDNVYITKLELCCVENGNVNGDGAGLINLADITKLIDHVYITKAPTAACE